MPAQEKLSHRQTNSSDPMCADIPLQQTPSFCFPTSCTQHVYSFEIRAALLLNPEDMTNKILFSQFLVLKASSFFLPPLHPAIFIYEISMC